MQDSPPADPRRLIAPQEDKRTFRRFAPSMLAFVRLPEAPAAPLTDSAAEVNEALYALQPVPVRDLSMTGLAFFSRLAYPADADVEVRLCLNRVEYAAAARVKRRQRVENRLYGYGVNFVQSQTTKEFRVALAAFLLLQDAFVPPASALRSR